MSLFDLLFGTQRKHKKAPASVLRSSTQLSGSPGATRRELIRVVLRDTLKLHGVPAEWITAELLNTTSREGKPGMHVRLVLLHWEPRLLVHCVALQNSLQARLEMFDPLAGNWYSGLSWRFALADESACPPMPEAAFWRAAPPEAAPPEAASPAIAAQPSPPQASAHVASPLLQHSQPSAQERREALEKLLAEGDREHHAAAAGADNGQRAFRPTEPAGLV